ncbi:phage tail sheath C-terminal domain-containing protein [Spartinivicinus ruber]|uniref:phage tail sheath C-terminal domain-containing protein n=1 Tax=Spartinivicinus ruber TaxID=2683272 RepID=UPI0013D26FA9|nr:phage tail sheath C-terminal domain-containing protein [Spartinivicinus ruber]
MTEHFLHGVEVVEIDSGPRPIRTVRSSVIGLVGTAPEAKADQFPINKPVLIAGNRKEAAPLGKTGTLPAALDAIFDQAGAMVVVIRVEEHTEPDDQLAAIIGGVNADTGNYEGVHALLSAESVAKVQPKLLIVPEFTQIEAVTQELLGIADRLRAVIIADGPNTTDNASIEYRGKFGSPRVYLVDPAVTVFDTSLKQETAQPASPRVAGLIARIDHKYGFWWSPSNKELYGLIGTHRPIDFTLGDPNARANVLNENEVATIIQKQGYRLWGNRTCASDPKWAFLSVRRTADMINESLLRAHLWAVDRNIDRNFIESVTDGVNSYLRTLKNKGAIIGGECWLDEKLNTPANIADGKVFFNFDFTPPYPAEHITFQSSLVNDYLEELSP